MHGSGCEKFDVENSTTVNLPGLVVIIVGSKYFPVLSLPGHRSRAPRYYYLACRYLQMEAPRILRGQENGVARRPFQLPRSPAFHAVVGDAGVGKCVQVLGSSRGISVRRRRAARCAPPRSSLTWSHSLFNSSACAWVLWDQIILRHHSDESRWRGDLVRFFTGPGRWGGGCDSGRNQFLTIQSKLLLGGWWTSNT